MKRGLYPWKFNSRCQNATSAPSPARVVSFCIAASQDKPTSCRMTEIPRSLSRTTWAFAPTTMSDA
eukprot:5004884-Prymnesium_polylepis.1